MGIYSDYTHLSSHDVILPQRVQKGGIYAISPFECLIIIYPTYHGNRGGIKVIISPFLQKHHIFPCFPVQNKGKYDVFMCKMSCFHVKYVGSRIYFM